MKDSTVNKFNTHLLNFINELKNIYPSMKDNLKMYDNLDLENTHFLVLFLKNIKPHLQLIIENNIDIIKQDLFENINLSNVKTTVQTKNTILKYINVMFIQSFRYNKTKEDLNEILRLKTNINLVENLETKAFLISISNLKTNKQLESESPINNENENENKNENEHIDLNLLNNLPINSSIMEGSIGKLAMDIAKDIDISKLEINNPMEMLQGIMSGDLSKNSSLQNLFGNITEKINTRLNSGEVDKDAILSDAQNIMEQTKNMSNNNYFQNIQKNINENLQNLQTTEFSDENPNTSNITENIKQQLNQMNEQLTNHKNNNISKETLLKDLDKKKKKYLMKKLQNLKKKK